MHYLTILTGNNPWDFMNGSSEFDPETEAGQKNIEEQYNKSFQAPRYQMAEIESEINKNWLYIIIISLVIIIIIYNIIRP